MGDNEENYEKCINLDCGSGYFHKKNATHINCSDEKCNLTIDKEICCDKEDKTLNTIGNIIIVFSIITLVIILGLGFYKMSRGNEAGIYSRHYILNLMIKILALIFYIIPLDGLFVTIINKLFKKNWSSFREIAEFPKWGIFQNWMSRTVVITIISFTIAGLGFYLSLTKEMEWLKYIMILIMIGLVSVVLSIMGYDAKKAKNPFPKSGDSGDKRKWLFMETGKYLKYIIGSGIALAILSIVIYLFANNILFTVGGTQILMALLSLVLIGIIYFFVMQNKETSKVIKKNKVYSNLFYIFFLIPCLFHDLIKYIYNELKYTPNVVYGIFLIEIIVIALYMVIPMIQKKIYNNVSVDEEKTNLININIQNLKNEIYILKKQKEKIIGEFSMVGISKNNLKKIKDGGMDSNNEELKLFLLDLDFKEEELINTEYDNNIWEQALIDIGISQQIDFKKGKVSSNILDSAISMVKEKTNKLRGIEIALENKKVKLEKMKEMEGENSVNTGVLLRDPVCLKKETRLNKITTKDIEKYSKYNYNYAISGWFFIRANKSFKNEFKPILNYNNRPKILYNAYNNKLKVVISSGIGLREYIYNDLKLQKWFNIVINYDSGVLDIFIDKKFVSSMNKVLPGDMSPTELIVGGGGVSGGVCNIVIFPNSISKERIDFNYNLLKNRNPPIV